MKVQKEIPIFFWEESKACELSTHEKLLLIYLISHPATNRLGCFRLPLRYIANDLEWSKESTQCCFNALIEFNFLIWDATTEWSYLTDFLDWFPIKNSYQGHEIEHVFNEIPYRNTFFKVLVGHLLQIPYLDKIFRQHLVGCWENGRGVDKRDFPKKGTEDKQKIAPTCWHCGETFDA